LKRYLFIVVGKAGEADPNAVKAGLEIVEGMLPPLVAGGFLHGYDSPKKLYANRSFSLSDGFHLDMQAVGLRGSSEGDDGTQHQPSRSERE
jgi:hypothetical protein